MGTIIGLDAIDYAVEQDFDFIAYAISPWHILGINAVLDNLKSQSRELRGVVFICRDGDGLYTIGEKISVSCSDVEMFFYESSVDFYKFIRYFCCLNHKGQAKNRKEKIIIFPHKIDAILYSYYAKKNGKSNTSCYVIDEGLGSYFGINMPSSSNRLLNGEFWKVEFKKKILKILEKLICYKLCKKNAYFDYALLKKKNHKWYSDKEVLNHYKTVISSDRVAVTEIDKNYDNAVLINTHVFDKEELSKEDADFNILILFCKKCFEHGIKVVLKPHPAEQNIERYKCLEEYAYLDSRKGIAQEKLLGSMQEKPIAVVSFYSSTLLTSKLLFDIPTYSLNKVLIQNGGSAFLKRKLKAFMNEFDKIVCFADSIGSIINDITMDA